MMVYTYCVGAFSVVPGVFEGENEELKEDIKATKADIEDVTFDINKIKGEIVPIKSKIKGLGQKKKNSELTEEEQRLEG